MRNVLITGGTGSLGTNLTNKILHKYNVESITVFSRDEERQYMAKANLPDAVKHYVKFVIGDVRDIDAVKSVIKGVDTIFHAAALKQVPLCENQPLEAVKTNILGVQNVIDAIRYTDNNVSRLIGVSTDKACEPINTMGMSKSIMERLLLKSDLNIKVAIARYGNVINSRGSVIPLFNMLGSSGKNIPLTDASMTRFLMSLDESSDTILYTAENALNREIIVPNIPSASMLDLAELFAERYSVDIDNIGVRPGEKLHEILISETESYNTIYDTKYYHITSREQKAPTSLCSKDHVMSKKALKARLTSEGIL